MRNNLIIESLCSKYKPLCEDYGGAFDIDPDYFFTKDDIVEFAQDLEDRLKEYESSIFYTDVYMDTPTTLTVEFADGAGWEYTSTVNIDMRRIRKPSDINKYSLQILRDIEDQIDQAYSY